MRVMTQGSAGATLTAQRTIGSPRREPAFYAVIVNCARFVLLAIERGRQRRALGRLDDRLLRDIGITRTQAERESARPFWQ